MSAIGRLAGQPTTQISSQIWGLGSDGLMISGNFTASVIKGTVLVNGVYLYEGEVHQFTAPIEPFPEFKPVHSTNQTQNSDSQLNDFISAVEISEIELPNIGELAPPYKRLYHQVVQPEIANVISTPNTWKDLEVDMSAVVLGPKNSGKSGLVKYLCNKLLRSNRSVYLLDLDPGQPEYAPPGVLSLYKVENLNFSPSYAHPNLPALKSFYFGYNSPAETPQRYLEMCKQLVQHFNKICSTRDVLIVNTTGWTRGIGMELNSEIIRMVNPTQTVHMGPSEFQMQCIEVEPIGDNSGSTITAGGFSSAELRNLQLMAYFHQHNTAHITEWPPYDLKIGEEIQLLSILDSGGIDLEKDWGVCIEGTIVGICGEVNVNMLMEDSRITSEDSSLLSDYLGLGVVQYVDLENQRIRLLTPIDPPSGMVSLVRGRIQMPIFELYNKELGQAPYISTSKPLGIGGSYTKFRRNIQR